jgi:hypothetical protein
MVVRDELGNRRILICMHLRSSPETAEGGERAALMIAGTGRIIERRRGGYWASVTYWRL